MLAILGNIKIDLFGIKPKQLMTLDIDSRFKVVF